MKERLPFIDWMKALGMLVIIYGHASGGGMLRLTEPFNLKQLGVAFFIFVLGYSLGGETRPPRRVLLNRLFEIYLWGLLVALVLSVVGLLKIGDPWESNYLPFALGLNILTNDFPTNTTTWYIGMYIHMLLLWALLVRSWRVKPWMLVATFGLEVLVRAAILETGKYHIAYMMATNWIVVFMIGKWYAERSTRPRASVRTLPFYLLGLLLMLVLWPRFAELFDPKTAFPWSFFRFDGEMVSLAFTSLAISFLYLVHTWLIFQITIRLPDLGLVRFFARNTLIVFIVHMPLVTAWSPALYEAVPTIWMRLVLNVLIYYVGLSLLSELLRRIVPVTKLRDRLAVRLLAQPQA